MNIKDLFKIKLPFIFLFVVSLFLIFSDFVLLQSIGKKEEVLGASKRAGAESGTVRNRISVSSADNIPDVGAHISKVKNSALEIKKIAKAEKESGDNETGDEVIKSVDDITYNSIDNIKSLEEIDKRPAWKNFLLGPDYKNLGKIRSNLVQNRNQIRKIEKTIEKNKDEEDANTLRARLGELEQERLKIFNYIDEKDDGFSLFGWLAKLMSGYNKSIEEEEDLGEEVEISEDTDVSSDENESTEELDENEDDGEPKSTEDTEVAE